MLSTVRKLLASTLPRRMTVAVLFALAEHLRQQVRFHDPAITTEVYGHLDVKDMRKGLNPLNFHPPHGAATE